MRRMWVAYQSHNNADPDRSVYGPGIISVRDGLLSWRASRAPFSARCNVTTVARALQSQAVDAATVLAQFAELQAGDLLVWVGVAGLPQVPWVQLRRRNVTTIYYNSEPLDKCFGSRARHVSPLRPTYSSDGQQCILRGGHVVDPSWVDEVWDYSSHNIELGEPLSKVGPQLRFVPPGATRNASFFAHSRDQVSGLSFLGSVGLNTSSGARRNACWKTLRAQIGHQLEHRADLHSEEAFARYSSSSDKIFLNLHRRCDVAERVPLEMFRLQRYLSAGQLVLSERSHPADEAYLHGIITFANFSNIVSTFKELANHSRAARVALALDRFRAYVMRCDPGRILRRSGAFGMLDATMLAGMQQGKDSHKHEEVSHAQTRWAATYSGSGAT